MQRLTFSGFLKRYVASLSLSDTTAVYPLVREVRDGNLRLREPLLLYAMSSNCAHTLLSATRNTELHRVYSKFICEYSYPDMLDLLKTSASELPEAYHKVWRSYLSVAGKPERDERVKELMRVKVSSMQKEKKVSTYRVCKDLNLNNANVNAWIKNGTPGKVRLDTARAILQYLENA